MTIEERLSAALRSAADYPASPDLWDRVVHSIEEDRLHRRRVWIVTAAIVASLLGAVGIALTALEASGPRMRVDWRMMEALEAVALVAAVAALGPAIRRFGRGYAGDIFTASPETGGRLLRLLDVAYYLVFGGYVLVTVRMSAPISYTLWRAGDQISEAAARMGGLLLAMGALHAVTVAVLPLVGLVFNTTRTGGRLPRWVVILLGVIGVVVGGYLAQLLIGLMVIGAG